jgi:ribose-phosphate pyrophosphokinase
MYIIGGSASKTTAEDLAKLIKQPLVKTIIKRFPDNELYLRLMDDIAGEDVIIVQTTFPDQNIIELLLLQDAAYEAEANTITVVIPYFGYGRQDKKFEEGEPISARAIAEHISLHADHVITVDPHKEHLLDFFAIPAISCSAFSEIAQYLTAKGDIDLVLAPDKGAITSVQQVSKIIGCEYDYLEKTRIDGRTVEIKPKNLAAQNKNAIIIDDIISTGGTMAKAIKELKKQQSKKVYVACTHGVFVNGAKEKLLSAGCDEIICTDTVQSEFSKVKIAPAIAKTVQEKIPF